MLARDAVIAGYEKILLRRPESEAVIEEHRRAHISVGAFERSLRRSAEYRQRKATPEKGQPWRLFSRRDEPVIAAAHVITAETVDAFIAESDAIGPPSSPEVAAFWNGSRYRTAIAVDENLDPFSDEYVEQQLAVYCEISGRRIDQQNNELTDFDFGRHVEAANPYADFPAHSVAMHMSRIARAIEQSALPTGAQVLDLGCGWGTTSELMAYAGLRVTALDINQKFVDLVNARATRNKTLVKGVRGTFEEIPGDELYDAALYYESLHHAIRPWETLSLVNRRLRPGGKLLLAGEPINDMWKHWGLRLDPLSVYCVRKFGWFESGWSEAFLRSCLERSGFAIDYFAAEAHSIGWIVVASKV